MSIDTFHSIVYIWILIAIVLFPIQIYTTAPYGRHTNNKWGSLIDNRLGWVVMEIISPLVFAYFFLSGTTEKSNPMWLFFMLWLLHYFNRSILYPLHTKTKGKQIPILIVVSALFFNVINGWTNGYYLGSLSTVYKSSWFSSPQFIIGIIVFILGAYINITSDNHLLSLRKNNDRSYKIPGGRLFRYISCPNHFGEIVEWAGFAILTWNIASAAFAIWTAANLIPRALSHHKWYQEHFKEYPQERKAVIPFIV